jgi:phosphoglycolate phosphatase
MYRHLLFDLDGTLTDSAEGIYNSIRYGLHKAGVPVPEPEILQKFLGPPLYESYQKYCGMTPEQSMQAVCYYREYFSEKGLFENAVIPGIPELLTALKGEGYHLHLATAKPEVYAIPILRHFGLYDYFEFFGAATLTKERSHKDEVVRYVLENAGITDKRECVMIGDRDNDVLGAKACGIACIGVLFGYGSREELEGAGADFIAGTPGSIAEIVKNAP